MQVKGHNQLNISFFALIIVAELFLGQSQTLLPTVSGFASYFPQDAFYGGYGIVIAYLTVFFAFTAGAHFPDLDLNLKFFYSDYAPQYLYHRTLVTHGFLIHLALLFWVLYLPHQKGSVESWEKVYMLAYYFELGVFTHLIGDIVTGSVPFLGSNYVASSAKFSNWRLMGVFNKLLYTIFMAFPKLLRYFVSPLFLVAFAAVNLIDMPIIVLSVLFEQKFKRIGAKVVDPKKFERFWHYLEPWVFAAIVAFLLKVRVLPDVVHNFGLFVAVFIFLLSVRFKLLGVEISYENMVEAFERNHNRSFFLALFALGLSYYAAFGRLGV